MHYKMKLMYKFRLIFAPAATGNFVPSVSGDSSCSAIQNVMGAHGKRPSPWVGKWPSVQPLNLSRRGQLTHSPRRLVIRTSNKYSRQIKNITWSIGLGCCGFRTELPNICKVRTNHAAGTANLKWFSSQIALRNGSKRRNTTTQSVRFFLPNLRCISSNYNINNINCTPKLMHYFIFILRSIHTTRRDYIRPLLVLTSARPTRYNCYANAKKETITFFPSHDSGGDIVVAYEHHFS